MIKSIEQALEAGKKESHDRGWDDCNLWVIFDHETAGWKRETQNRGLVGMLEQMRKTQPPDTRTDKRVHYLIAFGLAEWERIENGEGLSSIIKDAGY